MLIDQYRNTIADITERTRRQYEKAMDDLQDTSDELVRAEVRGEDTSKLSKDLSRVEDRVDDLQRRMKLHNEQNLWNILRNDSTVKEEAASALMDVEGELDELEHEAQGILQDMQEMMAEYVEMACELFDMGKKGDALRAKHREIRDLLPDAKPAKGYSFKLHELPQAEDLHGQLYGRGRKPRPAPAPKESSDGSLYVTNDRSSAPSMTVETN